MITLRPYQKQIADQAIDIIRKSGLVILAMECRTGKTLTALTICENLHEIKNVLFLTKKKAISGIEKDFNASGYFFNLKATNYEQLGKFENNFDIYICDEFHCMGAFPKASLRTKLLKKHVGGKPVIYLSGTPSPESYSQIYHSLWVSDNSPYRQYRNFYDWAREYVNVTQDKRGVYLVNNYSNADKERILKDLQPIMITYTQEEAGFDCPVREMFHEVDDPTSLLLCKNLFKYRVIERQAGKIIADTPATLLSKLHQLSSGTCITDRGIDFVSDAKAVYIRDNFKNRKIAIYYKFVAELQIIKQHFPNTTDSPEEFQLRDNLIFVCQISSGREGITLSTADCIIMYNIDYSAVSYWQSRARLQALNRTNLAEIHWLFTRGGIETRVYKAVTAKKNFTASYFFQNGGV
jgi:hypothetical protein